MFCLLFRIQILACFYVHEMITCKRLKLSISLVPPSARAVAAA